jgi:hypothetical protein
MLTLDLEFFCVGIMLTRGTMMELAYQMVEDGAAQPGTELYLIQLSFNKPVM